MRSRIIAAFGIAAVFAIGVMQANAQTDQKKTAQPQSYRQYAARAVVFHYLNRMKGPPKISETPRPRGATSLCIHFPVEKSGLLVGDPTKSELRSFTVDINRDIFGKLKLRTGGGDIFSGPCAGAMQPFPELERLAAQVKACRDKADKGCGGDAFEVSKVAREIQRLP